MVSDDRYAQPGGPSIGDPFAVLDDAGQIFIVGLLDSYDGEHHLYCIAAHDGRTLMGFPPDRLQPLKALIGSYVRIGPVGDADLIRTTLFKPSSIWDAYTALNPTLCVTPFTILLRLPSGGSGPHSPSAQPRPHTHTLTVVAHRPVSMVLH